MNFAELETADLIHACAEQNDADAWNEFIARFHNVIASTVIKACRSVAASTPELIDDLIQDVYLKLCSNSCQALRDFVPLHPDAFFGFLKAVSYSVVKDHFRKHTTRKRGGGKANIVLDEAVAAASGSAEIERDILVSEIQQRVQKLSQRDRSIFWMHFKHGMSAQAISQIRTIGLSGKGVASTIRRIVLHLHDLLGNGSTER
jgi:RNA polymerase sigma-70 factor, ECF subfamily